LQTSEKNIFLIGALLAAFYFIIILTFVSVVPIGSSSEAREAHIVQVIFNTGEWLLPSRNGIVPSKPPLFHWVAATFVQAFGVSPHVAARTVSALSASFLLFLTYLLAARLFPKDARAVATLSFFLLATNYEFMRLSLDCRVDMLFSLLVFIAIAAGLECSLEIGAERGVAFKGAAPLFYLGSGLAVLAKGPLGIVLPFICVFTVLWLTGGFKKLGQFLLRPTLWTLAFCLLALPWYVHAAIQGNEALLSRQLLFENLHRFIGGDSINNRPFWYYFINGLRASFPCFEIFLLALPFEIGALWKFLTNKPQDASKRVRCALLILFLLGLLFFSLASGKRYSYLAPLFPFLSIYSGVVLVDLWNRLQSSTREKWFINCAWAEILVCQLLVLLLLLVGLLYLNVFQLDELTAFVMAVLKKGATRGLLLMGTLGLAVYLTYRGIIIIGDYYRSLLVVCAFEAIFISIVLLSLSVRNGFYRYEEGAAQINAITDTKKISVIRDPNDEHFDVLLYYLNREILIVSSKDFKLPCEGFVLAKREWIEKQYAERSSLDPDLTERARFSKLSNQWKRSKVNDSILLECS